MSPSSFANYPAPIEGPDTGFQKREDHNPSLRGIPLVIASEVVSRSPMISQYLWRNTGSGVIKDMAALDDVPFTFHPCVTPLGKTGPMLDFPPELLTANKSGARYYTASDYHAMYKSGQLTPRQVAETILSLIGNPGKYDNAWADPHGADHLCLEAAEASTRRYAAGKSLGVLDGVPIGVKDDIALEGYVSHIGMKYNASEPFFTAKKESAWPIQKLLQAGAVVVRKNRMHELGADTSGVNAAQGTPTNHLNNEYYPGGSSSGAGSALGAGIVPICIGTDAGGSIRIPANFAGVYGLKPSHHRTVFMNNTMCVTGPLAASAADLTIAYRVMAQSNPACSTQGRFALSVPPEPAAKRIMGIYRDWWNIADPRVADTCNNALDYFAKCGYEIVDISIPYICEAQIAHGTTCIVQMATGARQRTVNPANWLSLVSPANKLVMSVAAQTPAPDFLKFNSLRTLLMQHLAFLFQKYPGLLIMTPTTPLIGWPHTAGDEAYGMSDTNTTIRNMSYVFLANLTGTPSVSAPVGYVNPDQGTGKLPVSLMATGEWGSEEQLLGWASQAEEYLHQTYEEGRRRPDDWADVISLAKEGLKD